MSLAGPWQTISVTNLPWPRSTWLSSANVLHPAVHHSDRGVQYAAHEYRKRLRQHGMLCSMSCKGDCWNNAPMESFFATLKGELVDQREYLTRALARALRNAGAGAGTD